MTEAATTRRLVSVADLQNALGRCEAANPIVDYVLPADMARIADVWALAVHLKASHVDLDLCSPAVRDAILRWSD